MERPQALHERQLEAMVRLHEMAGQLLLEPRVAELKARTLELGLELLHGDAICLATREDTAGRMSVSHGGVGRVSEGVLTDLLAATEGTDARAFVDPDARVPHLSEDGFGAAIVAPIHVRGSLLGHIIVLRTAGVPEVSEEETRRAGAFAAQVGVALFVARANAALASRVEELLRTRDDLVLAEKLRLAGELAAGIALELSHPLAAMRRGLQALQGNALPEDDTLTGAIDDLREGVRRIGVVTAELGRRAELPAQTSRRALRVASSVERCLETVEIDRQIALAIDVGEELHVMCARDDLQAALAHVIDFLRAARATGTAPGQLRIRAYARERNVVVAVCDPALRLGPEARRRVLDPRLTREGDVRLELALALAQQLLRRNGGDLIVQDALDGTRFQLLLERGTPLELCP